QDLRLRVQGRDVLVPLLEMKDFTEVELSRLRPLEVGRRPSLPLLRDRQFMPRPARVAEACAEITSMLEDDAEGFYQLDMFWIEGRSGSGKSVLLLQVMQELVAAGRRVAWLKDDASLLLPILDAVQPLRAQPGVATPELIFIDDLYA